MKRNDREMAGMFLALPQSHFSRKTMTDFLKEMWELWCFHEAKLFIAQFIIVGALLWVSVKQ